MTDIFTVRTSCYTCENKHKLQSCKHVIGNGWTTSTFTIPKGEKFIDTFRRFFENVKVPGQADKIAQIIDAFVNMYIHIPNDTFFDHEQLTSLCHSVILLNVELHNACLRKNAPSKEEFVHSNKEKQVPDQLLKDAYKSIKKNKIMIAD